MTQFSYKDISIRVLGVEIKGLAGHKWKRMVEKAPVYGAGNKALGIQHGNEKIEGTLKLLQSDYTAIKEAIKKVNPVYNITDVSFDIIETYGKGLVTVTNVVKSATFTEYEVGMDQGDLQMTIELPYLALDVLENI